MVDTGGEGCTCGNCKRLATVMVARSQASSVLSVVVPRACVVSFVLTVKWGIAAAQRWFDFSAEAIALQRTRGASKRQSVIARGAGTNNFVLGSDNVDLDKLRAGLSVQANIQTGPGSNLEVAILRSEPLVRVRISKQHAKCCTDLYSLSVPSVPFLLTVSMTPIVRWFTH